MGTIGEEECWIGLAELRQVPGSGVLMDANEAFAICVGKAPDKACFKRLVARRAATLGFRLLDLEDVENLSERWARSVPTAEARYLREQAESCGEVVFGTLHTWVSDDS